jgi:uncharacterized protein
MNLRVSDFCHLVEGAKNLVAMYNALTLGVVIVDKETADLICGAKHKIIPSKKVEILQSKKKGDYLINQLMKYKLVFPLGQSLDLEDYSKIQAVLNCKRIGILYLLTTDICNLACTYCFIESAMPEGYEFSTMSEETARFGVDLFAKSLKRSSGIEEPQIIFYGGEPLANFAVVEKTLAYINRLKTEGKLPPSTSVTINTNGTLINEKIVSVLKRVEKLNVAISLDGPKEIHDLCRKYHSGGGTYSDIMKGYRLLVDNNIEAGFCCTISRYNVDHLEEIAKWFVDELGAKSIGFNLLIESNGIKNVRGNIEAYAQKAARQIINCFRFFRERGVYEDRIMRKVNAFVDGYIYYHDCGGCGQQIVVSPDGMVGVCQGYCGTKKYFVYPDTTFDPLEHPIWEQWRYRSPLYMPQCRDCIALSVCGGGCPYSADMRHRSIWELDDIFCVHAKATVEFLIRDLIERTSP